MGKRALVLGGLLCFLSCGEPPAEFPSTPPDVLIKGRYPPKSDRVGEFPIRNYPNDTWVVVRDPGPVARFVKIGEIDEKPRLVSGVVPADGPSDVRVQVVLRSDGLVARALCRETDAASCEAAYRRARFWRFAPAHEGGEPVATEFIARIPRSSPLEELPRTTHPSDIVGLQPLLKHKCGSEPFVPLIAPDMEPAVVKVRQEPVYPEIGRRTPMSGVVIVNVYVDSSGAVCAVEVLAGLPRVTESIVEAVSRWEFEPARINDSPVPSVLPITIDVDFTRE